MKTLKSLLYVFLAAFLFVGCNDDENFNPVPLLVTSSFCLTFILYHFSCQRLNKLRCAIHS